jgi:Rrf2 family protein
MRRDSRLSVALHVLLHVSEAKGAVTSGDLGSMMKTNPVVLRRTMAGLRKAGIVRSEKGHGGGWSLARALDSVTLCDVYDALGMSAPFSLGYREQAPRCLLEQAVNRALGAALADAEALLLERLRGTSVAAVLAQADHGSRRRVKHA